MLMERASCRGGLEVEKGRFYDQFILSIILLPGATYLEHFEHWLGEGHFSFLEWTTVYSVPQTQEPVETPAEPYSSKPCLL